MTEKPLVRLDGLRCMQDVNVLEHYAVTWHWNRGATLVPNECSVIISTLCTTSNDVRAHERRTRARLRYHVGNCPVRETRNRARCLFLRLHAFMNLLRNAWCVELKQQILSPSSLRVVRRVSAYKRRLYRLTVDRQFICNAPAVCVIKHTTVCLWRENAVACNT